MTAHVGPELSDFLAGGCAPGRRGEIEEHLRGCEACAAERVWLEQLREEAVREGLGHLAAMRIVELAAAERSPTPLETRHLESCEECHRDLDWAHSLPAAEVLVREAPPVAEPTAATAQPAWRRWIWPGLAAVAAGLLLLVLLPTGRPSVDLPGLARIEPMPVEIVRGTAEPGTFEAARERGLAAYAAADYAGARRSLKEALAQQDDDTASLYLASAELLGGMLEPAAVRLRGLAADAPDVVVREEAAWQLANLELSRARAEESRQALQQVIALDGYHRAEAQELLEAAGMARR